MVDPAPLPIVLREYVELDISLETATARALASNKSAAISVTPSEIGWRIRPSQFIGVTEANGQQFVIQPKIPMENALIVLGASAKSIEWSRETFDYHQTTSLLAAMVMVFRRGLDFALARGLRHDYRAEQDRLQSIRGRIDIAEVVRKPGSAIPIPCRFDEYTTDNRLNRLLLAGISRSLRVPGVPREDKIRLRHHLASFEGVGEHDLRDRWSLQWTPTRLDRHYEAAVRPADLIVHGDSVADRVGSSRGTTFLVDMNKAVENFITERITHHLHGRLDVLPQAKTSLDIEGRKAIYPDLVFKKGGQVAFVADIKYKDVRDIADASSDDLYQLNTYALTHGLKRASLITCPSHPGPDIPGPITLTKTGIELHVIQIDLSGAPAQIEESFAKAADLVEKLSLPEAPTVRLLSA